MDEYYISYCVFVYGDGMGIDAENTEGSNRATKSLVVDVGC